jgi:hypothetical protein
VAQVASVDDPLLSKLVTLFEDARELVAAAIVTSGVDAVVTTEQLLVEDNADRTGWQSRWEEIEVNVLAVMPRFEYKPALQDWAPSAYELAVCLEERFRDSLPPPSAVGAIGMELVNEEWLDPSGVDATRRVMAEFVLAPTRWYLTNVKSVKVAEPEVAHNLATEIVQIMRIGTFVTRQSVALERLRLASDLTVGSVRMRTLAPAERGAYLEPSVFRSTRPRGHVSMRTRYTVPTVELDVDSVIDDPRLYGSVSLPTILVALQLHQVPLIGPGVVGARILPEWYSVGTISRLVPMRQEAIETSVFQLTQELLDAAHQTADRLAAYRIYDPQRPAELALRRFSLGCGREDFADALVDFVVALEALLLPYDEQARNADLSYRFRMHGAHYIAALIAERSAIFRQLRDLYKIRSRLFH